MFHLLLLVGMSSLGICLPRQYHFINQNKTWAEAQAYCRKNYEDLVSINNEEEQLVVTAITSTWGSGRTWIGLYDDLNSWKWSLDDDSFYKEGEKDFRNWYIYKPWNLNEDNVCVSVVAYTAEWNVVSCSSAGLFICFDARVDANETYVVVYESMNWTEAQRYCRERYTDLTSVRNENENQKIGFLLSNIAGEIDYYASVWIGLYKHRYWSDKSNSSFSYWNPGEPSYYEQGGYCVAVSESSSGKWTAKNCSEAYPFICYNMTSASSRRYHFIDANKTWTEAQTYCRENFIDLATIDNMEEMKTIYNLVNATKVDAIYLDFAWIGLYDDVNSWRWSLEDDAFYLEGEKDFRGWKHQPDNINHQELCVSMELEGKWLDEPCTDGKPFVCYNGTTNTFVTISKAMTWDAAQSYCRANHRDLASVRNENDLQAIMNATDLYEGYDVWIGLYRKQFWSDQSNLTYTNWIPIYLPTRRAVEYLTVQNPNKHCASADPDGRWRNEYCLASFPFICYSTFTPGAVMGLRLKIKSIGESDLKKMVLINLLQELSRQNLLSNISLSVKNIQYLSPLHEPIVID